MNHDVSHCSGMDIIIESEFIRNKEKPFVKGRIVCPRRDTCYRYKAYLDIPNMEAHRCFGNGEEGWKEAKAWIKDNE